MDDRTSEQWGMTNGREQPLAGNNNNNNNNNNNHHHRYHYSSLAQHKAQEPFQNLHYHTPPYSTTRSIPNFPTFPSILKKKKKPGFSFETFPLFTHPILTSH